MEIQDVQVVLLSCPFPREHWHSSDLGTAVKSNAVLVKVTSDEGLVGWGESHGTPLVCKQIVENQLKPLLVGEDPTRVELLWEKMYAAPTQVVNALYPCRRFPAPSSRRGERVSAISGVDIALWDLKGKIMNQPVFKILGGGGHQERIRAYASAGGWKKPEELAKEALKEVEAGFTAFKMRTGMGKKIDVERVRAVREAVGDDIDLMVDFHGTCDVPTSIRMTKRFERYDPYWIEEPVPPEDMDGMAEVRSAVDTPVATGERLQTIYDFKILLEKRAADIIQPEAAIAGGLTESKRIAVLAQAWNLLCSPHGWSNAIGMAAALHLAAAIPNTLIFEFRRSYNPLMYEIAVDPIQPKNGFVEVPKKPGLGVELDEKEMKKYPFTEDPVRIF